MKRNLRAALYFVVLLSLIGQQAVSAIEQDGNAKRSSFNNGWLFSRFGLMPDGSTVDEPQGLEKEIVKDSHWRSLDLPHDWGIDGPFRMDLPSSTGKLPWAGIGWYRKHFRVSSIDKEKRFFIDIDGAMSHAKVWLNGKFIGEWPYGYTSFRLELTPCVRFDKENVLSVRLDNPSNSSRWYPGGGMYRNVWLVKTAPIHIAHWGTTVTTPKITPEYAVVRIKTEVENQLAESAEVTVSAEVREFGSAVSGFSAQAMKLQIPCSGLTNCEFVIPLPSPRLWNLDVPHLYHAVTIVRYKGTVIDSNVTNFGIRDAKFTAHDGFILNGKRVQIQGVCNHHDLGLLGTAVNTKALERQVRLLQEVGCNAIRTSHNPPAPELLDVCDRLGMLVVDEAFDCWQQGKTPNDYSTLFKDWHERDIRAFVKRDRNHPSVIMWSAGNEIREQGDSVMVQQLKEIFYSEDPSRPVTAGCDKPEAGFDGFQNSVDVFGYNYKPHMYKKFHEENPDIPLYGSETASCVSTYGEYFFPVGGDRSKSIAQDQVSSYDLYTPWWATIPDVEFEGQERNPFVAGEFVWTGFDYLGEPAPFFDEKSVSRSSYFGIFDLCGFKKDRYYLYQSRWRSDLPSAHILPHWNWPERKGISTPVQVYTSGDEAELFLNGQSLGRQKKGLYQYRFRWDSVTYSPGLLEVVTYKNGKRWATDQKKTTGDAISIVLSPESSVMMADGKDVVFIPVKIIDHEGLQVPTANQGIRFTVTGPAVIAAVGNGDPTNHRSFQSDQYEAFHGQCMLVIRSLEGKSGLIQVTAASEGLTSGLIRMNAR
jgi:beta-galactosidase